MNEKFHSFRLIAWKCLPFKNEKIEINQKNNKINKNKYNLNLTNFIIIQEM